MKFEQLPNEILIECFEYLDAIDIFYSFDHLSYRFYTLIRNISLHLNLHQMNKLLFDQFYQKMLSNPQIKGQIISLQLSNKNICGQLNVFLSFFSLNEFSQLRSLTLIDLEHNNTQDTRSILLLLSDFCHGYFNKVMIETGELLPVKIQITSIPIHKIMVITSLTIKECYLDGLCQLFKYAPSLKYLCIRYFKDSSFMYFALDIINVYAIYLKELVMDKSNASFEIFELLLKQTPNLKILTINVHDQLDIIDAKRWEKLISSSLHQLNIFNFIFSIKMNDNDNLILNKFQQYQTDFWHKQHRWYTIYEFNYDRAYIYTIPYMSNEYRLTSNTKQPDISLINSSKIYENVTNLSVYETALNNNPEIYFQNIKLLSLMEGWNSYNDLDDNQRSNIERRYLQSLQMTVNFSNLKRLYISCIRNNISSNTFLEILKQSPQLSSLVIDKPILISFFYNNELCQYLNTMIKILDINPYHKFITRNELNKLCEIFSNIEELRCCISETDTFLFILNHLPKLKNIKVKFLHTFYTEIHPWLKLTASKFNINCIIV